MLNILACRSSKYGCCWKLQDEFASGDWKESEEGQEEKIEQLRRSGRGGVGNGDLGVETSGLGRNWEDAVMQVHGEYRDNRTHQLCPVPRAT